MSSLNRSGWIILPSWITTTNRSYVPSGTQTFSSFPLSYVTFTISTLVFTFFALLISFEFLQVVRTNVIPVTSIPLETSLLPWRRFRTDEFETSLMSTAFVFLKSFIKISRAVPSLGWRWFPWTPETFPWFLWSFPILPSTSSWFLSVPVWTVTSETKIPRSFWITSSFSFSMIHASLGFLLTSSLTFPSFLGYCMVLQHFL